MPISSCFNGNSDGSKESLPSDTLNAGKRGERRAGIPRQRSEPMTWCFMICRALWAQGRNLYDFVAELSLYPYAGRPPYVITKYAELRADGLINSLKNPATNIQEVFLFWNMEDRRTDEYLYPLRKDIGYTRYESLYLPDSDAFEVQPRVGRCGRHGVPLNVVSLGRNFPPRKRNGRP